MGLLDKVKNLFVDEGEEPIKSEVIQVEIPAPVKEETKPREEQPKVEPEVKEEKSQPIFFDDEYFKELEPPKKEVVKSSYLKEQTKIKEEKKHFKPTPIISPVYGVLDKNYNKEDIAQKKETPLTYTSTRISIDEVRKKAYGTLEDDLESTLVGSMSRFKEKSKEDDLFDELIDESKQVKDEPINIIDDDINMIEEEMNNKKDEPITESELFDLIDSMYEKGDQ